MAVDWGEVLEEAEDSPRGLLSEVLARVDDIENLVIIFHGKEGMANTWSSCETGYHLIAMLDHAKWYEEKKVYDRAH